MAKRIFKLVFYAIYIGAGSIIAFLLPDHSRFILGFLFAILTGWCWRILSDGETQIVGRGRHTGKLIGLTRVNGHLKPTYLKEFYAAKDKEAAWAKLMKEVGNG